MDKVWLKSYESRVPATLTYPNLTLSELLLESARKFPYNTATNFVLSYLIGERYTVGGKLTYRKLNELVDRFANGLAQLGVRKGDRVAIMLPNSPQYIIAFFATMRLGALAVNFNPTYTAREIQHQLSDSGAETMILLNLFWPRLHEIQSETAIKRTIVTNIYDTLGFPSNLLVQAKQRRDPAWVDVPQADDIFAFQKLLDSSAPTPPYVEVLGSDTALLQYTGGTTGIPKGAMLTHDNLIANTIQINAWMTKSEPGREKIMAALPFFHVYGMTAEMLYGIYIGAEIVVVPNPRPIENVMNVIQKEHCSIFPGVPAMYIGIVNHPEVAKHDLHSVKACISGSSHLPMEIQERFEAVTGGRLVEGFGMTECSPITHGNPVWGRRKNGAIGVPFPDTEAKLIDTESSEEIPLGSDRIGELYIRGPQVMKGYWQQEEETANALDSDGWFHSGDICRTDDDGYFYVVDRKKDMINASGLKVLPREVEEVLFMHPQVLEAVVVGIPHPQRGDDTVKAYIVLKPNEQATVDEIKTFCKQYLAPYKIPRAIEFRNELPKTIVGKVLRRVLVEEEKQKQAISPIPTADKS